MASRLHAITGYGQDDRQRDFAPLGHQDVVGTAGRLVVHAFDADPAAQQACEQSRRGKALFVAGAQDQQVGSHRFDCRKILSLQCIEIGHRPGRGRLLRQHHQAMVIAGRIDLHPVPFIAGDRLVLLGCGRMQLHRLPILS